MKHHCLSPNLNIVIHIRYCKNVFKYCDFTILISPHPWEAQNQTALLKGFIRLLIKVTLLPGLLWRSHCFRDGVGLRVCLHSYSRGSWRPWWRGSSWRIKKKKKCWKSQRKTKLHLSLSSLMWWPDWMKTSPSPARGPALVFWAHLYHLVGCSAHPLAASAGAPYSRPSTCRWYGGFRRSRIPWCKASAPASDSSPEPSLTFWGGEGGGVKGGGRGQVWEGTEFER